MSAEVLRKAAALMRERAEAVDYPSPWSIGGGTCGIRCNDGRNHVGSTYGGVGAEEAAATHIASWHPAVALAVAHHLAVVADGIEGERRGDDSSCWRLHETAALAVATAYLGDQS